MPATQEERAKRMIEAYDSVLNLRGDDGNRFVLGLEHWCMNDDGVNNWSETDNYGIATLQDNAYDGVEAKRAAGKDSRGYPVGGEEADYGNLLGPRAYLCDTAEAQKIDEELSVYGTGFLPGLYKFLDARGGSPWGISEGMAIGLQNAISGGTAGQSEMEAYLAGAITMALGDGDF